MKTMTTRYYDVADEPADPDIRSEAAFLREIDLLIWVLDSQRSRIDGNRESLEKLQNSLARLGRDPSTVPAVMVLNKRDLMDVQTESEMANLIVWRNRCSVPMIASEGAGFVDLMSAVQEMLAKHGRFIQLGPTT